MTLKQCPGCKKIVTSKNVEKKGRDAVALYFNCNFCHSTFILRSKRWAEFVELVQGEDDRCLAGAKRNAKILITFANRIGKILFLVFVLSGCVTTPDRSPQLVDTQNRDYSTRVIDMRRCLIPISYFGDSITYDMTYYYACMDKKGYVLEQQGPAK